MYFAIYSIVEPETVLVKLLPQGPTFTPWALVRQRDISTLFDQRCSQ